MSLIGIIGAGMMGLPLALRLLEQGFDVLACDRDEQRLRRVERAGARTTISPADCAACDLVLVIVNTERQLRDVVTGPGGLTSALDPADPCLVAVMSTVNPELVIELATAVEVAGGHLIDAPVSGGEGRARDGTLTIMTGATSAQLERAQPAFDAIASRVFVCGSLGAGSTAKALNNVLSTLNAIATAEVLRLGAGAGIPAPTLAAILDASSGRNFLTADASNIQEYYRRLTDSRDTWSSIVAMFHKDAVVAEMLADAAGASYPAINAMVALVSELGDDSFETWSVIGE